MPISEDTTSPISELSHNVEKELFHHHHGMEDVVPSKEEHAALLDLDL